MKTARAILERGSLPVRRMTEMLIDQLTEIMPEYEGCHPVAGGWRRSRRNRFEATSRMDRTADHVAVAEHCRRIGASIYSPRTTTTVWQSDGAAAGKRSSRPSRLETWT